jgi:predicted RNase H-like HicB family nuclease
MNILKQAGVNVMAKFTATVEQAGDGNWTAALFGEKDIVLGIAATKEEALEDLRRGLVGLIEHLKGQGKSLQPSPIEIVTIEVVA